MTTETAAGASLVLVIGAEVIVDRMFGSLNDSIRSDQQRRRDGEADRLRGLEVDDQLKLRWLLHGEVGGPCALQNLVNVGGEAPPSIMKVGAIGHEIAVDCEVFPRRNCGDPVLGGELGDQVSLTHDEQVGQGNNTVDMVMRQRGKGSVDFRVGAYGQLLQRQSQALSRGLRLSELLVFACVE